MWLFYILFSGWFMQGDPDVSRLITSADEFMKNGEYLLALELLDSASTLDNSNDLIFFKKAMLYENMDNLELANDAYKRAISIHPKAMYFNNIGINLAIKGKYDEAIEQYDQAIEVEPEYAQAWLNKAAAYYYIGDANTACEFAEKSLNLGLEYAKTFLEQVCE